MYRFILVLLAFAIFLYATEESYVDDYCSFYEDTCESFKVNYAPEYDYIRKALKGHKCIEVYQYCKGNYSPVARECFKKDKSIFECGKDNLLFKFLDLE